MTLDGDLFSHLEVVLEWVLPVDEPDGLSHFAEVGAHLYPVAEEVVDGVVAVVQTLSDVVRSALEFCDSARGHAFGHMLVSKKSLEFRGDDVSVRLGLEAT